ncbi:MAG: hypothetical protein HY741_10740 [Chloroflexi bacterium]|nr:hypothetical protein [Chloroflexota bacterium]
MSGDLVRLGQDVLVVLFLFALRVGIPLLILFVVGAWLKKLFEPQTTSGLELVKVKNAHRIEVWSGGLVRRFRWIQVWLREQATKHV